MIDLQETINQIEINLNESLNKISELERDYKHALERIERAAEVAEQLFLDPSCGGREVEERTRRIMELLND